MSKIHDILRRTDDKQWYLRIPDGSIYPADEPTLREWAKDGRVKPDYEVSLDQETWQRADTLPSLASFFEAAESSSSIRQAVASVVLTTGEDSTASAKQESKRLADLHAEDAASDSEDSLKAELESQKSTIEELEKSKAAQTDKYEQEIAEVKSDAESARSERDSTLSEIGNLRDSLAQAQQQRANDQATLGEQQHDLQASVTMTTRELDMRNKELARSKTDIAQVEADFKQAETKLRSHIAELESQTVPDSDAQRSHDAIAQLESTRGELKQARKELETAKTGGSKEISTLNAQHDALKKKAARAEKDLQSEKAALLKLEDEKKRLLAERKTSEAELKNSIAVLQEKVPSAAELKKTQATVDALDTSHAELAHAREELATYKAGQREQLAALQKEEKALTRQTLTEEKSLSRTETELEELRDEHEALRTTSKGTIDKLRQRVASLRDQSPSAADIRDSKQTVEFLQDAKDTLVAAKAELADCKRAAREELAEYKRHHQTLEKQFLTNTKAIESERTTLKQLGTEHVLLRASSNKQHDALKKKVETLSARLPASTAKKGTKAVEARIAKTRATLSEARENLSAHKKTSQAEITVLVTEQKSLKKTLAQSTAELSKERHALKAVEKTHKERLAESSRTEKALLKQIAKLEKTAPSAIELRQSKTTLARLEKTQAQLATARGTLKTLSSDYNATVAELKEKQEILQLESEASTSALATERKNLDTLQKQYKTLQTRSAKNEAALKKSVDKLKAVAPTPAQLRSQHKSVGKLESARDALSDLRNELRNVRDENKKNLDSLEKRHAQADENAQSTAKELDDERSKLATLHDEHKALKSGSSKREDLLKKEISALEKSVSDAPDPKKAKAAVTQIEQLEKSLSDARAELDGLTRNSALKVESLSEQQTEIQKGTASAQTALQAETDDLKKLQQRYKALERRSERKESKLLEQIHHLEENAASSSDMLESAFEAMQEQRSDSQGDVPLEVTLLPDNAHLDALSGLTQKLEEAEEQAAFLQTQLDQQLKAHSQDEQTLKNEIAALHNTDTESAPGTTAEADAAVKEAESKLSVLEATRGTEVSAASEKTAVLEKKYKALLEEAAASEETLNARIAALQEGSTTDEAKTLHNQIAGLRQQLGDSEGQIQDLNEAVEKERARTRLREEALTEDQVSFLGQFDRVQQQAEDAATLIQSHQSALNSRNGALEKQMADLNAKLAAMQGEHLDEKQGLADQIDDQKEYYEKRLKRSLGRQEELVAFLERMQSTLLNA